MQILSNLNSHSSLYAYTMLTNIYALIFIYMYNGLLFVKTPPGRWHIFRAITTVNVCRLSTISYAMSKTRTINCILVRISHLNVILWAKHRLLRSEMGGRGGSRVPDQFPWIKISSAIKRTPPQIIHIILLCRSKILVAMGTAKKASHDIARLQQKHVCWEITSSPGSCIKNAWVFATWKQNASSNLTSKLSFHKHFANFH